MPFPIPYDLHNAKVSMLVISSNPCSLFIGLASGPRLVDEGQSCSFERGGKRVSFVILVARLAIENNFLDMIVGCLKVYSTSRVRRCSGNARIQTLLIRKGG